MPTIISEDLRLTSNTLLQRQDARHLTNNVGEEIVLLDLETGDYLGLNRVAATIWRLLEKPKTLQELESALMAEYETDLQTCQHETHAFLRRIAGLGMLVFTDHLDREHEPAQ